jgi:translation initiation factor IF-3
VSRFLKNKDKVKITIMFRGREVTHPERGTALLDKLAGELSEIGVVEQSPVQDGRNMTMLLAPSKAVLAGEKDAKPEKPADGRRAKKGDGAQTDGTPEDVAVPAADEAAEASSDGQPEPEPEPDSEPEPEPDSAPEPEPDSEPEPEPVSRSSRPRGAAA